MNHVFHTKINAETTRLFSKVWTKIVWFQIFRSLNMPLRQKDITKLSLSLSECIAECDLAFQSWAIEILLTMLQTCEITNACLNKNETKWVRTCKLSKQREAQLLGLLCLYWNVSKLYLEHGASATEMIDSGSIPNLVKSKTIKIGIHSFPHLTFSNETGQCEVSIVSEQMAMWLKDCNGLLAKITW